MGTSGRFGGSKRVLIPTWVDEPAADPPADPYDEHDPGENGDEVPNQPEGEGEDDTGNPDHVAYPPIRPPPANSSLRAARGNLTRGARTSDDRALRRGAGQYVAAAGGGRRAARLIPSSRALAVGIAGLAKSFANQGPVEALRRFNLEGLGAPAEDVFSALADVLCPQSGTIDEAIARDAMIETIAALAAEGIGNFDEFTREELQEFFMGVVSRSIVGKILNEVGTNSVHVPDDVAAVEGAQQMLHDFVDGCVRDEFEAADTELFEVDATDLEQFVDDLYAASLDLVQALGGAA